ncbi:MAG: DUF4340 domain-containing protein [Lewinellaceae bacterium]|nr:DUF4340 domain-containing protein [Lewinellaceae bacterium]
MKRTYGFLLVFLVLGGLAVYWWLASPDTSSSLGKDRLFKVEQPEKIAKIFLAHRDGTTVTLEKKKNQWIYDGKWPARPNAIENLLDALTRIQIKYQPPRAAVANMVTDLATQGIKVEVYDVRDRLLKAYYVGGATADERGTYLIMEGAEQPYVGELAGWEGNLRFRFNLRGDDWRDKTIFAVQPKDIKRVTIEYPKQRNQSFRLERSPAGDRVTPFYELSEPSKLPLQAGRVEAFLIGFESLVAEAFENDHPRRDSLQQQVPFSVITLTHRNDSVQTVKLYPIYPELQIDPKTGKALPSGGVERYLATTDSGDIFLVQDRVFNKILWAYAFFFTPPK